MPVLPLVASMRILSLVSSPRRSPSRIIDSAARSLTLPPGLCHSALAYTSTGATDFAIRLNDSNGVLPIRSRMEVPSFGVFSVIKLIDWIVTLGITPRHTSHESPWRVRDRLSHER